MSGRTAISLLPAGLLDVKRGIFGGLIRSPASLARNHVGAVPLRPMVLRSGRFVLAMSPLGFPQELGERGHVQVESASGKQRRDLLEQPAVPIWIAECRERSI